MDYNVEYDKKTIMVVEGDTINMTYSVSLNDVDLDMTGKQIDMSIYYGNTVIKTLSSAGVSPAITITTTTFTISTTAFDDKGTYRFDIQLIDGTRRETIAKGTIYVTEELTYVT